GFNCFVDFTQIEAIVLVVDRAIAFVYSFVQGCGPKMLPCQPWRVLFTVSADRHITKYDHSATASFAASRLVCRLTSRSSLFAVRPSSGHVSMSEVAPRFLGVLF